MKPMLFYAHFPYCLHKCPYCDFNTYAVTSVPEQPYVQALLNELTFRATSPEFAGHQIEQVFLGGGTPSLFEPSSLAKLLTHAFAIFPPVGDPEITLEANPGSLEKDRLVAFRAAGINRLSLGAQSFSPTLLKTLGRTHHPEDVDHAVTSARAAGINNISLDLIYGIPGQALADLRSDLQRAAALEVDHISAYCLTFEKGTPFFRARAQGKLTAISEDLQLEMMEVVNSVTEEFGYQRYEISNFCKPDRHSRHNLGYWESKSYLGIGAGAHGCLNHFQNNIQVSARRYANVAKPEAYLAQTTNGGNAEGWSEDLSPTQCMFERFFLGLRLSNGISLTKESTRFGLDLATLVRPVVTELLEQQILEQVADRIFLTQRGREISDTVIERFLECFEVSDAKS